MAVTTKAEAEALTVEELKTELKARGLPHDGSHLKAGLLEILLRHMDNAANGEPYVDSKGESEAVTRADDTEPAVTRSADETTEANPAADVKAVAEALDKDEKTPVVPESDAPVTRSADADQAVTRSADEVTGGTEEPTAKKTKTAPEAAPEEPKKAEEPAGEAAPAAEPAATA